MKHAKGARRAELGNVSLEGEAPAAGPGKGDERPTTMARAGMNEFDTAHHEDMSARLALGRALREMHKRSNRTLRAVERDISISDSTLGNGDGTDIESGDRIARLRRRIGHAHRSRAAYLAAGLVLGFALGAAATALDLRGGAAAAPSSAGRTAAAGATNAQNHGQGQGLPTSAATGTYCPWKYVVTDGTADNIRVFDDPRRDSIIARYAPGEVFYASEPPQIVNNMMKTVYGWIGMGNWVQRYTGATCRTGGY